MLLLLAVCLTACNDNIEPNVYPAEEGMVPLEVRLPEVYNTAATRATSNSDLANRGQIYDLPNGSTLRLIVLNKEPSNAYITTNDVVDQFIYIVQTANEKPYLYRCQVDEKGNLIEGTIENRPYYLAAGQTFYCMAISPARALTLNNGKYMLSMFNQEELLATNNHWNETKYSMVKVPASVNENAIVTLNPLMHTMARIRISVKKGTNIMKLEAGDPFIELSRVPSDPNTKWATDYFNGNTEVLMPTYNLAVGDSIEAQMGNNILHNRIYIHDALPTPDWQKDIDLMAETTILPMDARATPMIIRLMLDVNLTPMQFHFQTRRNFLPGYTYNYIATINLTEEAIYVASWQDASWNTTVDPLTTN